MRKFLEIGGFIAGAVLIVFGAVAIYMGVDGRSTVRDSLAQEQIVGSEDMTPAAIKEEAMKAGLSSSIALPTVDVAGKAIDTGARARAFADLHQDSLARGERRPRPTRSCRASPRRTARARPTPHWR